MIDKNTFHKAHHSRNMGLITEMQQKKINKTTLLIAGCGVGSQIALSAARIGFEKFIIVDGDTIDLSNNNRQGYSWRDVGKNKVDILARKLKAINPYVQIKKFPVFVDIHNAAELVHDADIVVDGIDPDAASAVFAMHRAAKKEKKYVVQPSDVGWGALIFIFSPDSITYEEMIGLNPKTPLDQVDPEKAFRKFIEYFVKILPPYVQRLALGVAQGKIKHYPQPISAAYLLSAMTVSAIKKITLGEPVITAPQYVMFDPDTILDPQKYKKQFNTYFNKSGYITGILNTLQ